MPEKPTINDMQYISGSRPESTGQLMRDTHESLTKVELPELGEGLKFQIENYLLAANAVELTREKKLTENNALAN